MRELDKILNPTEKILWEGKPGFLPFVFNSSGLIMFIIGLIWSLFTLIPFGAIFLANSDDPTKWVFLLLPHTYIGPFFMFCVPVYNWLVYKYTHYAITDKRVLIQNGVIGRDFEAIDYDQITNISVNVDLFDKIFNQNTGSILISTPSAVKHTKNGQIPAPHELDSIYDPYTVFRNLKQSSHDVKTDINYPNALRPNKNPGYNTELNRNPFKVTE